MFRVRVDSEEPHTALGHVARRRVLERALFHEALAVVPPPARHSRAEMHDLRVPVCLRPGQERDVCVLPIAPADAARCFFGPRLDAMP